MVKRLFPPAVPAAAFAVLVLLLAGCGSSKSSSTASSAAPAASGSTAPAAGTSPTTTAAATPAAATTITTKHAKLGTILAAGKNKLTVYLFEADKSGKSACSGACEGVWPPVTSSSMPQAGGSAVAADVGTVTRANGTKQVTYKGHPLYFFVKDKEDDDAYGQGSKSFGAGWYVMKPNGSKIDNDDNGGDSDAS